MIKNDFELRITLDIPFAEAVRVASVALKTEGFGILTEINVQDTLKQKLDVDFRRYKILGACNPPLAYQALQNELEIGLFMPCNVIVYEVDDGETAVAVTDPVSMLNMTSAPALQDMADQARAKLVRVIDTLVMESLYRN